MAGSYHTPVLLPEVLNFLLTNLNGIYVDATLGGGGHAEAVLERLAPEGRLLGIDADPDALAAAAERLRRFKTQTTLVRGNFGRLSRILPESDTERIAGVLFDFGVSSRQLDDAVKGFSYRTDSRLDMRMDPDAPHDAYFLVNTYPVDQLSEILWTYGEERESRRIAKAIESARQRSPIETTGDLSRIVESVIGRGNVTKSLARVFQALRIEVNNELDQIKRALQDVMDFLEPGGRIVAISYHSLEDKIVKDFFAQEAARIIPGRHKLEADVPRQPRLSVLTKSPVQADRDEITANPRARSAKLRAAERVDNTDRPQS
ncbi:MAG: 16S rRNA (cytosine(1402)-N(4))-methyltransferase RsmH [Ignavibacteria bacterium]|nr:16S rRNA (cytosine(1402)-N(4))-methyltransferase RsmH [Ignavibacteria bacterium]